MPSSLSFSPLKNTGRRAFGITAEIGCIRVPKPAIGITAFDTLLFALCRPVLPVAVAVVVVVVVVVIVVVGVVEEP